MSDHETALTGATAAPAPEESSAQVEQQTPAPAETDANNEDQQPRDEKGRFAQRRINELTREKWEARRELDRVREEVNLLRQQITQPRHQPAPDPNVDPEAYVQHLVDQRVQARLQESDEQVRQQQVQQRQREVGEQFQARIEAYAVEHPDLYDSITAVDSILGAHPAVEVIATSEHGAALTHYLGQHIDEAVRVARMEPLQAAAHLARLEARITAPKPKPVTAAPAPPTTVGGGSTASKDPSRMSTEEWMAWRKSQL